MKKEGKPPEDIRERTFKFALRIVNLCRQLDQEPGVGRTLGKQLLRSGTSIGANVEEAKAGQSKLDFISKNAIALKEARESIYWLRLLSEAKIVSVKSLENLKNEAEEIAAILGSIIIKSRSKR